jgi:hypothetical protein
VRSCGCGIGSFVMADNQVPTRHTLNRTALTNIVLKSSYRRCGDDCLRFCHFNPGSAVNHIDEINSVFKDISMHFICVSETWFKKRHTNKMMGISGYRLIRADRIDGRRGGGVGLYVKSGISYKVLSKSTVDQPVDFLFVDLKIFGTRILVGVLYCPPGIDGTPYYGPILEELVGIYPVQILMGDLNTDLLKDTVASRNLKDRFNSLSLSVVNTFPTHFQSTNSPSLIDLLITNSPSLVNMFTQVDLPSCNTMHDLIYGSMKFPISDSTTEKPYFFRDYSCIDASALRQDVESLDWTPLYSSDNVDDQIGFFNETVSNLFSRHVPLKKGRHKPTINPWFNIHIEKAIIDRNVTYRTWRVERTDELRNLYKCLRRRVHSLVKTAKREYMKKFLNPKLPSKTLWKNLDSLGIRKDEQAPLNICLNRLNSFFASNSSHRPLVCPPRLVSNSGFTFNTVSPSDVFKVIFEIKSNAVGLDEIPIKFLRILINPLLSHITHIFNSSITSGVFPTAWKYSKIIPIAKVADPLKPEDYRPISILPALSKALEMLMRDQMVEYLESNNALDPLQSGFRSGHSTTTALLCITDDIYKFLDEGMFVILVLLDFSKAFDTVNHELLCCKLANLFGFSSSAVNYIKSYLSMRFQRVGSDEALSGSLPTFAGVPQGSILGPLLFSLFINDLCRVIRNSKYHAYADDFQIYDADTISNISICCERINQNLEAISRWSVENGLALNAGKTKAMIICRDQGRLPSLIPQIKLNGSSIEYSSKVTNLGLTMDDRFSWLPQATEVRNKVNFALSRLWHFADVTPLETRLQLVKSLVLSHFLYCDVIFSQTFCEVTDQLNKAFNSCARYIFQPPPRQSMSDLSRQILTIDLEKYYDLRKCMLMYRLIHIQEPAYLADRLLFGTSQRLRNLITPRHNTTLRADSFFVQSVSKWNSILPSIKMSPSLASFRKAYLSPAHPATE